jgi:hypothetical protein
MSSKPAKTLYARTVAVALLAVIVIGVGAVVVTDRDDQVAATAEDRPLDFDVVTALRKDLVEDSDVDGTLGFGTAENLPNLVSGVVTWLPEPGQVMGFGDVLYEIDDRPVFLFEGETPMYRPLNGRTSDGSDVRHLEELLVALGHADEGSLDVDDDFTPATANAIEAWEAAIGVEETGAVSLGTLVYRTEGFRVSAVNVSLGQQVNGGSILSVTATERVVTVPLDTSLAGLLEEGQFVEVELADGTMVDGEVTVVSDVAVTDGQGPNASSSVEVEIVLAEGGAVVDESPVAVRVEEVLERDAIVVPIASLLALAEGGYAVEVVEGDGSVRLTGVSLGTFLGNEVSVTGDVEPGDRVVVP